MSLSGGIGKRGNPDGNEIKIDHRPYERWWLVPVVLFGAFFLVRRLRPATKTGK